MPRYAVTQNYSAERVGHDLVRFGPWAKGDEVEVDEADAEWINADSPGTLKAAPAKSSKAAAPKSSPPKPKDREGGPVVDGEGLTKPKGD